MSGIVVMLNSVGWMSKAACTSADPEAWFPDKGGSAYQAKKICATCPVVDECLQFALDNGEQGVWGGMSHSQRLRIIRRAS